MKGEEPRQLSYELIVKGLFELKKTTQQTFFLEIVEYALKIGIDPETEDHLLGKSWQIRLFRHFIHLKSKCFFRFSGKFDKSRQF